MANTLRRTPLHRPWVVWLAVLIAVFGALAPTLSHALALKYRAAPMEASYCSSMGMMDAVPDSTGNQGSVAVLVHCPLCLHVTDRLAPPESFVFPLLVQERPQLVAARTAVLYSGKPYLKAEPRGPPV